jgi:hypothetical protein
MAAATQIGWVKTTRGSTSPKPPIFMDAWQTNEASPVSPGFHTRPHLAAHPRVRATRLVGADAAHLAHVITTRKASKQHVIATPADPQPSLDGME